MRQKKERGKQEVRNGWEEWVVVQYKRQSFEAFNYSERLKVMTLTSWKFKGIYLICQV